MIKKFGQIIKHLLLILLILFSFSCQCAKEKSIDNNDEKFFLKMSKFENINEIDITSLNLYYINNHHFYDIIYNNKNTKVVYHILFVYFYNDFDIFFSLEDESNNTIYEYSLFLDAKENGIHKEFTEEEINSYIEKYKYTKQE